MLKTLAGLVAELRAVGIPVSPTEHIDAAAALGHTALEDRTAVRAALATTLVKNAQHESAFGTVFDLYFAGRRGDLDLPEDSTVDIDDPASSGAGSGSGSGDGAGSGSGGGAGSGSGGGLLGRLSDAELSEVLYRAIRDGDRLMMRAIAAELVNRHSDLEPGRRVAGVYYQFRALGAADLNAILRRLRDETGEAASLRFDERLRAREREQHIDDFRAELQAEIRERLVADRGPEDVARTVRRPLPEEVDFLNATAGDAVAIRDALKPLARRLAARLARKRRAHRSAPLDFRKTMRKALSTGGTPVELVFRKPHPSRPELIVVADISGSVATFASFTLHLVYALRSEFTRVRTFVFVDGIAEVTEVMERAENVAEATQQINHGSSPARISGGSDYGSALQRFERLWGDEIRSTSTVLILGDARNNYLAPRAESLAAISDRARHLYWLNPEPVASWNGGDSIIGRYAPYCDGVFECRNVRQLRQFVEQLG